MRRELHHPEAVLDPTRSFRRLLRAPLVAFVVCTLTAGGAVAGLALGTSLSGSEEDLPEQGISTIPHPDELPVAVPGLPGETTSASAGAAKSPAVFDAELSPEEILAAADMDIRAPAGGRLPAGTFLVGAATASLEPAPTLFGGENWQTEGCTDVDAGTVDGDHLIPAVDPANPVDAVDQIRGWPAASPDCIYLGGFGIGPVRPAERVGFGGVWVRTVAISNGERTFIYSIADTVGWFARYDQTICADCGILDVRERVAGDLGLDVGDVIVGSTHTHAGADTYGGWGGIPDWYRAQLRDAAIASAKQAVANMGQAAINVGEVHLRNHSNERRDTYYSTVDTGATWLQAKALPNARCGGTRCGRQVLATWTTFAGHPTIVEAPILHADWPGAAARRLESRFGGVGLLFEGGLGNAAISEAAGATEEEAAENTGAALADAVAADIARNPVRLTSNDMTAVAKVVTHPAATNPVLVTLADVGLFDREFTPGTKGAGPPGAYHWSRKGELSSSGEDNDPGADGAFVSGCDTAGPTVITTAGAHRIGDLVVAFAPGEIFSNLAEVVKERADQSAVTMVLGQTNDALGYIIQSFEFDESANVVTDGAGSGEYEEVFSIDRCFGDHVLETILEATRELGAGG